MVVHVGMGIAAAGLTAVAAWGQPGLIGTPITGPWWLRALLPLLMGAPLVLRRRAPLLMWTAIWAGMALALTLDWPLDPDFGPYPRTPEPFTFVLFAAAYSLGAHASLRRAAAGLVLAAPLVAEISHHGGLGLAFSSGGRGDSAGMALALLQLAAFLLAGVLVRARRQGASLAAWSAAVQRQAEQAAAAERARIARELHDIIATTSAWSCCTPPGRGPRAGRTRRPWRKLRTADGRP
jgi:signal transduction histidine kinase